MRRIENRRRRHEPSGARFTLLELLVALAVFAIMASAACSGLRSVLFTRAAIRGRQSPAGYSATAVRLDVEQSVPRASRDGEVRPALAVVLWPELQLTVPTGTSPLGQPARQPATGSPAQRGQAVAAALAGAGCRSGEPRATLLLDQVPSRCGFLSRIPRNGARTGRRRSAVTHPHRAHMAVCRAVEIRLNTENWVKSPPAAARLNIARAAWP